MLVNLGFLKEVIKCGLDLDSGIRGHVVGIKCLTGIPLEAMVTLGELCPRRGR